MLNPPFKDITLLAVDIEACIQTDPSEDLYDMHLLLSDYPSVEWTRFFAEEHKGTLSQLPTPQQRPARVSGKHIIISCPPEEIKQFHLSTLKKEVKAANARYNDHLTARAKAEAEQLRQEQANRERLQNINDDLDFDSLD